LIKKTQLKKKKKTHNMDLQDQLKKFLLDHEAPPEEKKSCCRSTCMNYTFKKEPADL
jgi:hypothetical protein